MDSPKPDGAETKAQFRKLSNDATNRKYRRHSPVNGSSASDESPKHERGEAADFSEHCKENKRELERESERNHYGKGRDSYRTYARSSRDSHRHSKHEDYGRREKYVDKEDRRYQESSHSGRNTYSERAGEKNDYGRSKEFVRDDDRFSRERYESSGHRSSDKDREPRDKDKDRHRHDKGSWDEKRDHHRSPRHKKGDRTHYHDATRGYPNEYHGKDNNGHRIREFDDDATKEMNVRQERKKHSGWDTNCSKDSKDQDEENFVLGGENQRSPSKKPKLFNSEKDADGKQSSQTANESTATGDLNAATDAAMKAAELVNRNLVGTGFMSTEQKKKLLWGNKKSTTAEQSGTQWNTSLFGDHDRQEKFNKLMGVKGDTKGEHGPETPVGGHLQAEKQKELQMDLEKQYTAGLRRRDGRTVGLGL